MLIGLGIDLVELERIERSYQRFGSRFLQKILHPEEIKSISSAHKPLTHNYKIAFLAARFAAKEAAVKALGTGFSQGISFKDIQVFSHSNKMPELIFHKKALIAVQTLKVKRHHVSLSHAQHAAVAVVVLER